MIRGVITSCLVAIALAVAVPAQGAAAPLQTALPDDGSTVGLTRIRASGATAVNILMRWRDIAPTERPQGFDPRDPASTAYQWAGVDERITRAVSRGLTPLVTVYGAPQWAEGRGSRPPGAVPGSLQPDPDELARFATAAARRYSGSFRGLPRVRLWQLWTEQNLFFHLNPQLDGTRPVSAVHYRQMLNGFSDAVHAVRADNLVITGGLAPFTTHTGTRRQWGLGPLHFMRVMLCMGRNLRPTCSDRARFDVWAHHPYTSGGPTHHAALPDDVSLGDLPEMKRLLDAAVRARRVVSRHPIRFWVTEFGWDTNPPDPRGLPSRLHARWTAEALYRMWSAGVSLVTWNLLTDQPFPQGYLQCGLYFRGSSPARHRPKPALRAFRFPFVALPAAGGRALIWGRTPTSTGGRVLLQLKAGRRWAPLAVVRADRHGIFTRRLAVRRRGVVRARYLTNGEYSLPFLVTRTKDRPMYAFGTIPR